ncbi:MAG: transketolase [Ignavibacteriae bacterium]|nr:transketolase [Ignavibacteriota bacterium]NOG97620.1 transketolase [Ignavibacteriota bacterium]
MSKDNIDIQEKCINTIRFLSVDAIQKANSGHPGITMGCAPIAHLLYSKIMKHNPKNPKWINRDRFILSAGHGSMLLYSALHLSGYDVTMDDIKNFRQWGSKTPGHPEVGLTDGVETTTGPLGQGFANAIGMAVAQEFIAEKFNKLDMKVIDHNIYTIVSDGDMMEGISHEAASFAGHHKLGSLVFFYDNNKITIDGSTDITFTDDTQKRFESYGWHVQHVKDVNDLDKLEDAVKNAKSEKSKPSLIITDTHIGFGSPNKQDTPGVHGSPLGEEEIRLTKKNLNWDEEKTFYVPDEVKQYFSEAAAEGKRAEENWNNLFENYSIKYREDAEQLTKIFNAEFDDTWKENLPVFETSSSGIATRAVSGKAINAIAENLPTLIGGSADLDASNNTAIKSSVDFAHGSYEGRKINFGIREHAMGSILNGMALYGGVIPYGGTFLIFSDYMRPAIRLAALCELQTIYVFTHDSIGLGEDGPTHQPIEQLAALRAIPNLTVIRPADANETVAAWKYAVENKKGPTALALTRQKLPIFDRTKYASADGLAKGAYTIKETDGDPDFILIATGSEVYLAIEAAKKLEGEGIKTGVVSFPSWEIFEEQNEDYKEKVLPSNCKARMSVEAGVKQGWEKYIGEKGKSISIETFGASAPYEVLFEKYGLTVENIIEKAKEVLKNSN